MVNVVIISWVNVMTTVGLKISTIFLSLYFSTFSLAIIPNNRGIQQDGLVVSLDGGEMLFFFVLD